MNVAFYSLEWSDTARDFKGCACDYSAMAAIGTKESGEEVNLWINTLTLGLLGLGVIFVWHSARA